MSRRYDLFILCTVLFSEENKTFTFGINAVRSVHLLLTHCKSCHFSFHSSFATTLLSAVHKKEVLRIILAHFSLEYLAAYVNECNISYHDINKQKMKCYCQVYKVISELLTSQL